MDMFQIEEFSENFQFEWKTRSKEFHPNFEINLWHKMS